MKSALLLGLLFAVAFATIGDECTPKSTSTTPVINFGDNTPVDVLYIVITQTTDASWGYNPDMLTGYNLLAKAVNDFNNQSTTKLHWLCQENPLTVDLTQYEQVWVADLCATEDNEANKLKAYQMVADWWQSKGQPHIITDGRWISSLWTYAQTKGASQKIYDYPPNYGRPNYKLVRNYFENLRVRGGGLVLATDHAIDFTRGINQINKLIGLNDFVGFFYEEPWLMQTDTASILLNWPEDPTHHHVKDKSGNIVSKWLWDDSSTSYSPFNLQPNGLILYPLGWHKSSGFGQPGISSTIRGAQGFLVGIDSPLCDQKFTSGDQITFTSTITNSGNPPYTYKWTSSVDGDLSTAASFTGTLSVGVHVVKVKVTDSQKLAAEARVRVTVSIFTGSGASCYVASYNGGPDVFEVFPISRTLGAVDYFNKTNTPDKLLEQGTNQWFFYDDGTTTSIINLVSTNKRGSANAATGSQARYAISGLAGATLAVPGLSTRDIVSFDSAAGTGKANLKFNTDGLVFTNLPRTAPFCGHFVFNGRENLDDLVVRSHNKESATVPNTNPIVSFRVNDFSVKSLDLCRTQCRCASQTLTALTDAFTNTITLDSVTGNYGRYFPNQQCSWLIQPKSNDAVWGVAVYFKFFQLASGDSVSIYAGTSATGTLVGTYTGTTNPGPIRVDGPAAFITFTSDDDGKTDIGFSATYTVIPQLLSLTPSSGKSKGYTKVVATGANFINSNNLACQFDSKIVPAHWISSTSIECIAPMHNIGTFNAEVSNDGKTFTNTWNNSPFGTVGFTWTGYQCPN